MYIAIAGNICAGKSSLTRVLSQRFGFNALYESATENPYLSDFYRNMANYNFQSQIFFLSCKLAQREVLLSGQNVIQDRTIYEDAIFARALFDLGYMELRDYQTYMKLHKAVVEILPYPDHLIYIKVSLSTIIERVKARNEFSEELVSWDYVSKLNSLYEEWISGYHLSALTTVSGDRLDWVPASQVVESLVSSLKV